MKPSRKVAKSSVQGVPKDKDDQEEATSIVTEDVRFFEFAKDYLGLLASVASIPLLSQVAGVLPPPSGTQAKLTLLSSFVCLIAFASSFLLKGPIGRLANAENTTFHIIPFLLCGSLVLGGTFGVALYMDLSASASQTYVLQRNFLYVLIHPIFVLALGIVLVTAFTQQGGHNIQSLVDSQLPARRHEIFTLLRNLSGFYELGRSNAALASVGDSIWKEYAKYIGGLSNARLDIPGAKVPEFQRRLLNHTKHSFHAVSDRDLSFWVNEQGDSIPHEYFNLNIEYIKKFPFTRVFIFSDEELSREQDIVKVLKKHQTVRIGWAIVCYEEVDDSVRNNKEVELDFSLFDLGYTQNEIGCAFAGFFRDYRGGSRRYRTIFDSQRNADKLMGIVNQYRRVLSHCWAANNYFSQYLKEAGVLDEKLVNEIQRNREQFVGRIGLSRDVDTLSSTFFWEVDSDSDIEEVVSQIRQYRDYSRQWQGRREFDDEGVVQVANVKVKSRPRVPDEKHSTQ